MKKVRGSSYQTHISSIYVRTLLSSLLILQSFDWLAAFHLDLLQAILFIAV